MARRENELLPAVMSPWDRHKAALNAGMHPTIEFGTEYWQTIAPGGDHDHLVVKDGDRLIGLVEDGECPVCGERGGLTVRNDFRGAFVKGIDYRRKPPDDPDGPWEKNPVLSRLNDAGYRPLVCDASYHRAYIGVASPPAVEKYTEWRDKSSEISSFRKRVASLHEPDRIGMDPDPGRGMEPQYDHGDILAAIFEVLGADDYDELEYLGRDHVAKNHLVAILDRLLDMETRLKARDQHADYWLYHREQGIGLARVEWSIPEWAEADGLVFDGEYTTNLRETN